MSFLIRDIILKRLKIRVISLDSSAGDAFETPVSIKKKAPAGASSGFFRKFWISAFTFFIVISQVGVFSAFEAHIINVTAHICEPLEVRSMGYWMNHHNVYIPYLPQYLGNEEIDTVEKAQEIFSATPFPPPTNVQRVMLKKHLLAMKFNLAHFAIGGYPVEGEGKTLNQIAAEADALLLDPNASKDDLEAMKDLLDKLNAAGETRFCYVYLPKLKVAVPNGGEEWWAGHYYDITWASGDLECPNDESEVSIWYSSDSGESWANIVRSTDNDGVYNWRVPLFLNGYYVPSGNARIKIVARCSETQIVAAWDMSDEDFCPPIDYQSLTDEEKAQVEYLLIIGILIEESIINREAGLSETDIIEEGAGQTDDAEEDDVDEIITETEEEEESAGEEISDEEAAEDEMPDGEAPGGEAADGEQDKDPEKEPEDEEEIEGLEEENKEKSEEESEKEFGKEPGDEIEDEELFVDDKDPADNKEKNPADKKELSEEGSNDDSKK